MFDPKQWAHMRLAKYTRSLENQSSKKQAELDTFEDVFDYYCLFTKMLINGGALFATSPEAMIKFWQTSHARRYINTQKQALKRGATIERFYVFSTLDAFKDEEIQEIIKSQILCLETALHKAAFTADSSISNIPSPHGRDYAIFCKKKGDEFHPKVAICYRETTFYLTIIRKNLPNLSIPFARPYISTDSQELNSLLSIHQEIKENAKKIIFDPKANKLTLEK